MTFYCITQNDSPKSREKWEQLLKACNKRNIPAVLLDAERTSLLHLPTLQKGDLLYRATPGKHARIIEQLIMTEGVASCYSNPSYPLLQRSSSFLTHAKFGLPIIPTVADIPTDSERLASYVESIGGFPTIVKVAGQCRGVGVMKVDSIESLISIADFLHAQNITGILRAYIPHRIQGRLIVLGNSVIGGHANTAADGDFRSNAGELTKRSAKGATFPKEIEQLAIQAVHSLGLEFGGVDILFHEKTNEPYIAEVNFPMCFTATAEYTGIDIAGLLIDFLVQKSLS